MKIKRLAIFFGLSLALVWPAHSMASEVKGVRFGVTSPTETRVVIDLKGEPQLGPDKPEPADGSLSLHLLGASISRGAPLAGRGAGLAKGFRIAEPAAGAVAINLEFKIPIVIKEIFVISPTASNANHRLVIDTAISTSSPRPVVATATNPVASSSASGFKTITELIEAATPKAALEAEQTAMAAPDLKPSPSWEALPARPVIVIDAGHGGTDPGAAGQNGAKESAVTLEAAMALAEALQATGRYSVVLTRSKDVRLAHEERSRIARDARADLFMSIHADAHKDSKIRGGSVYTLSEEGEARSAREALAQGNYHVHDLDIGDVDPGISGILYDVAQKETETESDRLAEILSSRLVGVTPLLNNTHRRGNFKVLLAPDVPAVLLELAFISNEKDEKNLTSPAWRKKTMTAVAGAIDAYFDERRRALLARNSGASGSR